MAAAKNGNSVAFTALHTLGASPDGQDDRGRGLLSLGICSVCLGRESSIIEGSVGTVLLGQPSHDGSTQPGEQGIRPTSS